MSDVNMLSAKIHTLFDAIAHGDSDHRAWLKEAIAAHFEGRPVPPMREGSEKARLREELATCKDLLGRLIQNPSEASQPPYPRMNGNYVCDVPYGVEGHCACGAWHPAEDAVDARTRAMFAELSQAAPIAIPGLTRTHKHESKARRFMGWRVHWFEDVNPHTSEERAAGCFGYAKARHMAILLGSKGCRCVRVVRVYWTKPKAKAAR